MKKANFIIGLLLVFSLVSCASTRVPEPEKPEDTLVIGRFTLNCKGFSGSESINGLTKEGIELTILDKTDNKQQRIKTGKNGLFIIKKAIPSHLYQLVFYTFIKESGSSVISLKDIPVDAGIALSIREGKVNVLCDCAVLAQKAKDKANSFSQECYNSSDEEKVYNEFCLQYPETGWKERGFYTH